MQGVSEVSSQATITRIGKVNVSIKSTHFVLRRVRLLTPPLMFTCEQKSYDQRDGHNKRSLGTYPYGKGALLPEK